jgi:putative hydrolase of the HAD superfamily
MIQAIIFDLDDTLYPEKKFVESGYQFVARHIAGSWNYHFDEVFSSMMMSFDSCGRETVFPDLLLRFPEITLSLDEFVQIYRKHNPTIHLFPGYRELLRDMSGKYRLGIITDGLPEVQKKKVEALGLDNIIENIIYSWEYGAEWQKPHPRSFSAMLGMLQSAPKNTLFVGDNPEKDGKGAKNVGMLYLQIRHSQIKQFGSGPAIQGTPELVLESLFELPRVLRQWN